MVKRNRNLLLVLGILMCIAPTLGAQTPTGGSARPTDSRILEEKVHALDESTEIKIDGLRRELERQQQDAVAQQRRFKQRLDQQQDQLTQRTDAHRDALRQRIDIYLAVVLGLVAFAATLFGFVLNFFGRRAINEWAERRTSETVERLAAENLDPKIEELAEKVNGVIEKVQRFGLRRLEEVAKKLEKQSRELLAPIDQAAVDEVMQSVTSEELKPESKGHYWFVKAYNAIASDDPEAAVVNYSKAIDASPLYAAAYNNRGNAKNLLGDLEGAIPDYDKAIELEPLESSFYNNRAQAKSDLGDSEGAMADSDKAIELEPRNESYWLTRAVVKLDHGNPEAALVDAEKAKELSPNSVLVFQNLTEIYLITDRLAEGVLSAKRAVDLADSPGQLAVALYLLCVTQRVSGQPDASSEERLEEVLRADFDTFWSATPIERWLKTANLDQKTESFIRAKTNALKAKKRSPGSIR